MTKKNLILVAIVAVILAGVVLLGVIMINNDEFVTNITLSENGETHETLEFSAKGFHPGEDREYTINFKSPVSDRYRIEFTFEETYDGKLKDYIDVTVSYGGSEGWYEYKLADLLDGKTLLFDNVIFEAGEEVSFTITYTMPLDVGNEAQKATADFYLILTATRFE